ncbi:hypothetical protein [Halorarum halobium]|uniref:hypothetical protein n=1 Tax=Halorarum halobium TaxID=3075121 RepID=UPI0028AD3CBC|nr:hypothetical protein [Halobaculum sp. XH14]
MSRSAVTLGAGVGVVAVPLSLVAGSSFGATAAVAAIALMGTAVAAAIKTA